MRPPSGVWGGSRSNKPFAVPFPALGKLPGMFKKSRMSPCTEKETMISLVGFINISNTFKKMVSETPTVYTWVQDIENTLRLGGKHACMDLNMFLKSEFSAMSSCFLAS